MFFGGGTPSLIAPHLLTSILDVVERAPGAEVTVECNPDTVDEPLLEAYLRAGVTRLSFGVQSMVPAVLRALGRSHDPANVARCALLARTMGFTSWSMDLIYGSAGETRAQWRFTLEAALALEPPHLSAYALTVEPATPLARDPSRHPDDDDQAEKYLMTEAACADAGLESYEISNWARPGHECRHNLLYWAQGPYRGIGCAAHSHERGVRWWNVRTPERYIAGIESGTSPVAAEDAPDGEARRLEGLELSLRTRSGVPGDAFGDADRAALEGLIIETDECIRLTPRGRLLANEVALRLR